MLYHYHKSTEIYYLIFLYPNKLSGNLSEIKLALRIAEK